MNFNLNAGIMTSENKAVPLDTQKIYDVLIIGGGPAALTAAVYCIRKGVDTGLITIDFGGQVAETSAVENYMGYKYIEGIELVEKFKEQVKQFEIGLSDGLKAVSVTDGSIKSVTLEDGSIYKARALIITTGKSYRKLNVPGEKELSGRGVAYCAICDAPLFAGKRAVVVGGGNSGIEAAIDLARVASHVIIIQNLADLTADKILRDSFSGFKNTEVLYEHSVTRIKGTRAVEGVTIRNLKTGETREVPAQGVFVEIGLVPNIDFVAGLLELNEFNEIIVDHTCRTNRPGIFAAGDVTSIPYKQIIIAGGEGAKAALSACDYLLRELQSVV